MPLTAEGSDAMLRAPFDRAMIPMLLFFSTTAAPSLLSQSLSKEYLRLGGRVVAIESPFIALTVSPDPAPIYLSPGNVLGFVANRGVNWSVAPVGAGSVSPLSGTSTTLTAANPLPGGLTALILTATDLNGATSKSVSVPVAVPVSIAGSTTSMPVGSSAQFSADIPVTWELYPPNAGTVSPSSTVGGALVTVTIAAVPPGFPSTVTLTARDARALTDSRLQYNFETRNITVQYNAGPPQVAGGFGLVNP